MFVTWILPSFLIFLRINYGPVAQLARAPVLHSGGRRFNSCRVHKNQIPSNSLGFVVFARPDRN